MASLPDKNSMVATENESQQIVFQGFSQETVLNIFKWILIYFAG